MWNNLIPVTLGNVAAGALMVGLVYWFIYLRRSGEKPREAVTTLTPNAE